MIAPLRKVTSTVRRLIYMARCDAPLAAYLSYTANEWQRPTLRRFKGIRKTYESLVADCSFSNRYFDGHIERWAKSLAQASLDKRSGLKILEIGSFEGASTLFFLDQLTDSQITCVDTWGGSDEHQNTDFVDNIEERFDSNTAKVSDRIEKNKMRSMEYFVNNGNNAPQFDISYVDGSHHSDDVITDAVGAFQLLKPGGLMMFDDYLWQYYSNHQENPCSAINAFLKMKRGSYQLINVGQQVHLIKGPITA